MHGVPAKMIRYRLDDLGWYQFEWLIQSLLKSELGLAVESWGGHGDFGRDAYCSAALKYPTSEMTDGPFIFQVKFVENSNAAGAVFDKLLQAAVTKEILRIKSRRLNNKWEESKYYTLITNAPVSGSLRKIIKEKIATALPKSKVIMHQADDICDLLDKHEKLRRSFPQLLSLRDLDYLLDKALNKDALERSRAAIGCAGHIAAVFVPTQSYSAAWKTLYKHRFVVLHGPPEMGKTAIAWMILLTQAASGWEALVCDSPEDFFKLYQSEVKQIFVADDAFGRTEYDPSRGKQWEKQLERVVHMLDKRHWLIWTSRKHILERARRTMDLQGNVQKFPQPSDVMIDASKLSIREKALMLYRHARSNNLDNGSKSIIRKFAKDIVSHGSFTPERIRKFVREVLPELVENNTENGMIQQKIWLEIQKAISTPTDRMRKSFRALTKAHKAVLISLLEAGNYADPELLRLQFNSRTASFGTTLSFDEVLEELSEAFVRRSI